MKFLSLWVMMLTHNSYSNQLKAHSGGNNQRLGPKEKKPKEREINGQSLLQKILKNLRQKEFINFL